MVGEPRRTLKTLLTICNGGWLVTPDWLTASRDAGAWLNERPFLVPGSYSEAAERCREARAAAREAGKPESGAMPLHGLALHVLNPPMSVRADPRMVCNAGSMKDLARALGATVVASKEKADWIVATGEQGGGGGMASLDPARAHRVQCRRGEGGSGWEQGLAQGGGRAHLALCLCRAVPAGGPQGLPALTSMFE